MGKEPVGLSPAPEASGAAGLEVARALIRQGRFADALGVLRPLTRARETDPNVLFLIGMAATGRPCWTRRSPASAPC